jgi:hypothetical protein
MGGLKGVAATISGLLLNVFAARIPAGLKNIGASMSQFFGDPKKQYKQALDEDSAALEQSRSSNVGLQETTNLTQQLIEKKRDLLSIEDQLSTAQADGFNKSLSMIGNQISQVAELENSYNQVSASIDQGVRNMDRLAQATSSAGNSLEDYFAKAQGFKDESFKSINSGGGFASGQSFTSQLLGGLRTTTNVGLAMNTASNDVDRGNGALDKANWDSLG